ncbi:MAG: DUF6776 family protein [Steroidobacterales bacterium]
MRRWLMLTTALLLIALALYLVFELGRSQAGYDAMHAAGQRDALQEQIERLQQQLRELRVQLAAADEERVAQVRERSELARSIGELQAQVARQSQDLEFYRGIVPQQGQPPAAVRVQQFGIAPLDTPQRFALRFTLNHPVRPEEAINGTLTVAIDGTRNGTAATVDLVALGAKSAVLPFNFRYYSNIEQQITIPADFKPERVTIEIRPSRRGVAPYRQTFVWSVAAG